MASTIKVNTIQDAGGNSLLVSDGSGSITTNNINVKDMDWQSVVSTNTTMVAGRGYFVDSSGGTKTMTLPASPSTGDVVAIIALDGGSNAVTIDRNSSNIEGGTDNLSLDSTYNSVTLVYTDASNGWVRQTRLGTDTFIEATGGTTATSGNYKIHTFNSSSNFVVSSLGNQSTTVEYLVVAGGAGGGNSNGGGGGAGGAGQDEQGTNSSDTALAGIGLASSITGSAVTYAIGGTGGNDYAYGSQADGETNKGGGGDGAGIGSPSAGGSGVVILRYAV